MNTRAGIVQALTAEFRPRFVDHSRPALCGCAERAGSSHSSAQASAAGDAAEAPNFPCGHSSVDAHHRPAAGDSTSSSSQSLSCAQVLLAAAGSTSDTAIALAPNQLPTAVSDSTHPARRLNMTTQTAGIFTLDDNSAGKRDQIALIRELRELLTATIPDDNGLAVPVVDGPFRDEVVDLLRTALGTGLTPT
ncbi:hypothetical protein SEA_BENTHERDUNTHAT_57 [Gordonia phage BENtherdunthat]|uniref:Uncharacterized protein n=1 Tax=Gordonia phage BENtherdunthat TaxID=2047830 RepID=A0A2H4PF20_9CAUD|nr:hypothetical protein HOS44_gp057 [Gordonia phage BENtherdunthat]ATW60827.1 hypothetical protein SEA_BENTHERDUNTHAT_57 [Gordonia phage BENtherdunthat]